MAERIGTPVQGPMRIKSTLTPKPIIYSNEAAGGPWNVATIAQRNAIETFYRKDDAGNPLWGATCYVHSDPVEANNGRYELALGLVDENIDNNDNWQRVSSSTGGSSLTAAQIRDLYESNDDRNAYTDADKTKVANFTPLTASQIKISYESNSNTNAYTDAEKGKLALQSGSNTGDETDASILGKLLNNANVNIVTDAEKVVIGGISGTNTGDETPSSVQTKLLENTGTELFTTTLKDKLDGLEEPNYKGLFVDLTALQTAIPVGQPGWSADVDAGVGNPVQVYVWDESDTEWQAQVGESTAETSSSVKAKYEANPNTNEFNDAEKAKLALQSGTNTGDETAVSVRTKLLSNSDTNVVTDAQLSKLNSVETGATADQTAVEIRDAYHTLANEYTDADQIKVSNLPEDTNLALSGKLNDITEGSNITIDKTDPNNPIISSIGGGGSTIDKATQTQAETGTDDEAYMSSLKTIQSMILRAGNGIEWNGTAKRYDLVTVNNLTSDSTTEALAPAQGKALKSLVDKQFYLGAARTPGIVYDELEDEEIVTLSWNGFKDDFWEKGFDVPEPLTGIRIVINNNSNPTPWIPWMGTISILSSNVPDESKTHVLKLPSGDDSDNNYISINFPLGETRVYRFYRRYETTYWQYLGNNNEIGGKYPDETTTAPNIISSRNLAIGHAGASKINPVLSASLVNITVQPESTVPIPARQTFNYAQDGAGKINFIEGTGVTIKAMRNSSNQIRSSAQYGVVTLVYEGNDIWRAFGALETV